MLPNRTCVTFRVAGDALLPTDISRILGMEPSHSHAKGDPNTRVTKRGKVIHDSPFSTGQWSLDSGLPKDRQLEEHVRQLVDRLEPKAAGLLELKRRGFTLDLFCGCFFPSINGGLNISPELMGRLDSLGMELGLDLYFLPEKEAGSASD